MTTTRWSHHQSKHHSGQSQTASKDFFRGYCSSGERPALGSELCFTSERAGELPRAGMGESLCHPCLLIGFTQRKSKLSPIFMTRGSFVTWNQAPWSYSSTLWQRLRDSTAVFFNDYIPKDGSWVLKKKTSLGFRTGKRFLKWFTSQWGRGRIYSYRLSEVNVLRKWGVGWGGEGRGGA